MSFNEKEGISKEEWMAKLEDSSHIQRTQMNNLIMNYLVTGIILLRKKKNFLVLTKRNYFIK